MAAAAGAAAARGARAVVGAAARARDAERADLAGARAPLAADGGAGVGAAGESSVARLAK